MTPTEADAHVMSMLRTDLAYQVQHDAKVAAAVRGCVDALRKLADLARDDSRNQAHAYQREAAATRESMAREALADWDAQFRLPLRVQRSRAKGSRLPPGAVCVTRGTPWGNPFRVDGPVDMEQARRWGWTIRHPERVYGDGAIAAFAHALASDGAGLAAVRAELRGRDLACWCSLNDLCHADVLLTLANEPTPPDAGTKGAE